MVKLLSSLLTATAVYILLLWSPAYGETYDWNNPTRVIAPGIKHARETWSWGWQSVNCLRIDTHTDGIRFYTTNRCDPYIENAAETVAKTTRTFVAESQNTGRKVVAAINATEFEPYLNIFEGDRVNLLGYAVWNGVYVSRPLRMSAGVPDPGFNAGAWALVIGKNGIPEIRRAFRFDDHAPIQAAVSGQQQVLKAGNPVSGDSANRRTAIGICKDGRYVYFMTSSSSSINDAGLRLKYFGAWNGVLMDGGNSSGMAWWDGNSARWLFAGNRPVGNSIGVYLDETPVGTHRENRSHAQTTE